MSESTFDNTAVANLASEQMARVRELEVKLSEKETRIKQLEEVLEQEYSKTGVLETETHRLRAELFQRVALENHIVRVLAETRNGLGQLLELFLRGPNDQSI